MTHFEKSSYVELKRSIYREYSRSYDEDRDQFVSGAALDQRIDWALEALRPGGSCWTWAAALVSCCDVRRNAPMAMACWQVWT